MLRSPKRTMSASTSVAGRPAANGLAIPWRTIVDPLVEPRSITTSTPSGVTWNWAWVLEIDMSADRRGTTCCTVSPGLGSGRRPTRASPLTMKSSPLSNTTRQLADVPGTDTGCGAGVMGSLRRVAPLSGSLPVLTGAGGGTGLGGLDGGRFDGGRVEGGGPLGGGPRGVGPVGGGDEGGGPLGRGVIGTGPAEPGM